MAQPALVEKTLSHDWKFPASIYSDCHPCVPLALVATILVAYVTQPLVKYFLVFIQLGFALTLRAGDNFFQVALLLDPCNSAAEYTYDCFMTH